MNLVSHVQGNLWQGGCIPNMHLGKEYWHVISLYKWERYLLAPSTTYEAWEMFDSQEVPKDEILHEIAERVLERMDSGRTLVHCQAGLNRSGLICGLVLVKIGFTPSDAIKLLRAKRSPMVLCNMEFEAWLRRQA